MPEKVMILDGSARDGADLGGILAALLAELDQSGAEARVVKLREEGLAPCRGCFGCWIQTPGICRAGDQSAPLLEAMLACDTVVLLTPVAFGGYGSTTKLFVDHWIQATLPFFRRVRGETHHPPRYAAFPRIVAIGVVEELDPDEERLFKAVVVRNAVNFSAKSCSAGLVLSADPTPAIRRILGGVLPDGFVPVPVPEAATWRTGAPGLVLSLNGSPKPGVRSTSAVLAGHVLARMQERGWETACLTLTPGLLRPGGQEKLFQAAGQADLILMAFPLYIDTLPALATEALEQLAAAPLAGKAMAILVNNGFPEARQNELAIAICARFARARGMAWAGSFALGAGEALSGGEPLVPRRGASRPPVHHIVKALDLAASCLAEGKAIPAEASRQVDRSPIPGLPFGLWGHMFRFMGGRGWKGQARANGAKDLRARPMAPKR